MIVIGVDSHKRTHTVVAVDQVGRRLGERTVKATSDGHLELVRWSAQWSQVTFALEDCRHLTRRLEQDLLTAGQPVVRVPTRLMAATRRGARHPGKSDPIDAEAVALAALRHLICRWPRWTGPPGRSSCWSTTAVTWSASEPGSRTGSGGIYMSSTRPCISPRGVCAATR